MRHHLAPPGRVSTVEASRALVLAPHYDDEILGCGGLLGQLCERGSKVRVLFLSDGSGGAEGAPVDTDGAGYAARRRDEAAAVAELVGFEPVFVGLPDGALETRVDDLKRVVAEQLETHEPELVLVPSPLEVTSDHRAVFAALFEVLNGLREGQARHDRLRASRFLAYEVNHPGYPDLLVDVSAELASIEAAMALYASQQERHDYLAAALGLKRYRTLSLDADVSAAEGYRELALSDFTHHHLDELVIALGGSPSLVTVVAGDAISVVVRTRDRPTLLNEALSSLEANSHRPLEIVVVNDAGATPQLPDGGDGMSYRLVDLEAHRGRAAAANAGLEACSNDLIAFLDDDDLAGPDHLEVLARAARSAGVEIAYSDAVVVQLELDGEGDSSRPGAWEELDRRLPYSRDFDADLLLLDNYIPFNTLLFPRRHLERVGPFDESLPIFEDWDLLIRLAQSTSFQHINRVTCHYRHFLGAGHHVLGAQTEVDRDALFLSTKHRVLEKHSHLLGPERLARASTKLRREMVEVGERLRGEVQAHAETQRALRTLARENSRQQIKTSEIESERAVLQQRVFDLDRHLQEISTVRQRLESELAQTRERCDLALGENADLRVAIEDKMVSERELRAVVEDQTSHLERTYTQIGRLEATLEEGRQGRLRRILRALAGGPR